MKPQPDFSIEQPFILIAAIIRVCPMVLPEDITFRIISYDPKRAGVWKTMLSGEERESLASFKREKRRQEFLVGRVAARTLLAERLGIAVLDVPLIVNRDGSLSCSETALYVSIAHSGETAVAATGLRPIGVDLERVIPRHPEIARFLLHPSEQSLLNTLALDRDSILILLWTIKEATLKAMRTGLRHSPKKLLSEIDLELGTAVVQEESGRKWRVHFSEYEDHYLALAFSDT